MPDRRIDPDLIGIWIIPGEAATYEICDDARYHISEPAAAISFHQDAQRLTWGRAEFDRIMGDGTGLEGVWRDCETRDQWYFRDDGSYTLRWHDGENTHGIWALQDSNTSLWTREYLARIETNGAEVTFYLQNGRSVTYGYTVNRDVWTLMKAGTWNNLIEYRRP